jgi:plasmid stabilization system protein ParE
VKDDFRFTHRADSDLKEIWSYLARKQSDETATRVIARIYQEFRKLAEHPGMGHYRLDWLNNDHRVWPVWSYLIVYRWKARPIEIVAVVHGARDLRWYFQDDDFQEQ